MSLWIACEPQRRKRVIEFYPQARAVHIGAVLCSGTLFANHWKEIRLDTTHKIIEIAPGVRFSAWTFGDSVPGPAVRARVGDRIKFTMTN